MSRYEIIVENVGKVLETESEPEARTIFGIYTLRSKLNQGACAGKAVSLWKDGEPLEKHTPKVREPRSSRVR